MLGVASERYMNEENKHILKKLKTNLDKLVDASKRNNNSKAREHLKEVTKAVETIKKKKE